MLNLYLVLVERFVKVAETGSIQRAAVDLGLSQPSLTKSIKRIEQLFACELFERTNRGVFLTPTGERLLGRSKAILEQGNLARKEIADLLDGRTGLLRISACTAWGTCFLPSIIRDLQSKFPLLKVEFDITHSYIGRERLHQGEVDLFVGADYGDLYVPEGFAQRLLSRHRFAVGCGPNSPLAKARNVALKDLSQYPVVICHDDEQLMGHVIVPMREDHGVKLEIAVQTKSLLAAIQLVLQGSYIVFLADPILKEFASSGIKTIDLKKPLYEFDTAVYYRETFRQTEPFSFLLRSLQEFQFFD